jgi:hypothetical protein
MRPAYRDDEALIDAFFCVAKHMRHQLFQHTR